MTWFTDSLFAPKSTKELMTRIHHLAGRSVAEVAKEHAVKVPVNLKFNKGFIGELSEAALGAPRSSKPEPDFAALGIELKTLPIRSNGMPSESTYITRLDMQILLQGEWHQSRVRHKIARILFLPISLNKNVGSRIFGQGFLWSASEDEELLLQRDWEDFADLAQRGLLESMSARRGLVMQLRPKSQNSSKKQIAVDLEGEEYEFSPRGFYLRPEFTAQILDSAF